MGHSKTEKKMKLISCAALVVALISSPVFADDTLWVALRLGEDFGHTENSWQATRVAVCHRGRAMVTLETRSGVATSFGTATMFEVAVGDAFILRDEELIGDTLKQVAQLVEMISVDTTTCVTQFKVTTTVLE
jgi:hypothetical protein